MILNGFHSLYRGKVEDNNDPKHLGRCRIRVFDIHGEINYPVSALPWARPLALTPISKTRGSVNIPDIGDIVWVLFEGSDRRYPIYFGGTYSKNDINVTQDEVIIYEEEGNKFRYNRNEKTFFLSIGENSIEVNSQGITIKGNLKIEGHTNIYEDLTVGGSSNVSKNMNVGNKATVDGVSVETVGTDRFDVAQKVNELNIDISGLADKEAAHYVLYQELIHAGELARDEYLAENPGDVEGASKAFQKGMSNSAIAKGIKVENGMCQAFTYWCYEKSTGDKPLYESAKVARENTTTYDIPDDFSEIPIGASIFMDSSATPSYGHVAQYVGNGMVMHVKDSTGITYEPLSALMATPAFDNFVYGYETSSN